MGFFSNIFHDVTKPFTSVISGAEKLIGSVVPKAPAPIVTPALPPVATAATQANAQNAAGGARKASVYGMGFDGTIANSPLGSSQPLGTATSVLGGS